MDLCFSPSVIQIHHTNVPTSVVYYGYKLLGSFVGSDEYVLHALSMYVVQFNSLADRLITLCVHYQHLLTLLRHCFLTKVSRIIRTIPSRFAFVFATEVNDICYRIFCSFSQCLSSTLDDIPLSYHNYIDPPLPHSSFSDYFQSISQFQAQHPTMNIDTIISIHRHDSKLQFIIFFIIPSITSRS